ncbi:cullin-4A [Spinellus fusiger]|nr:cullin-4A [Spinellus fusiger]
MDWQDPPTKRARKDAPLSISTTRPDTMSSEPPTPSLPFSTFLSNSMHRTQRMPVLSDKKLMVYDKVERPPLSTGYEDNAWRRLQYAIHCIQQHKACEESLEVLYQLSENLCQYELVENLYQRLRLECQTHLENEFADLSKKECEGVVFLETVNKLWTDHCDQTSQLRCLFLSMDRMYLSSMTKTASIWNMATELFRASYLGDPTVREKLIRNILLQIQQERDQEAINTTLLQSVIKMLMDLSLYHSELEDCLLQETRLYYQTEGDRLLKTMPMSEYLEHCSKRVHQESSLRVKKYFNKSSKAALTTIVEEELLSKRVSSILDKGFEYFMENNLEDDVSLLYRLLKKVNKIDMCVKYFINYVKQKGTFILQHHSVTKDPISVLANFHRKIVGMAHHSFEKDERIMSGMKDGVEYYVNLRQNNVIELLARHTDAVLRNNKTDEKLLEGMPFFRALQGKDLFEELYKRDLAKRLLLEMTNRNAEKLMLNHLKKECGAAYTSKMEGMLRDIKCSNELMHEFKTKINENEVNTLEFKANILTHGFWPSYSPVNSLLPEEFVRVQELYQEFYTTKFTGRRLAWQHALGVCEVSAHYPLGNKKLVLTLLQTVVLLLFNHEATTLSFSHILATTQLDELELLRTLKSLACGPHKVLIKMPEGEDVEPTDTFTWNASFVSEQYRVQMNTNTLNEVIESNATLHQTVLISREQQVDAAIVRTMKSKRTLLHTLLMSEVMRQVRFLVTAQEVKKRVEVLIEKEFLERTDKDGYVYLD